MRLQARSGPSLSELFYLPSGYCGVCVLGELGHIPNPSSSTVHGHKLKGPHDAIDREKQFGRE